MDQRLQREQRIRKKHEFEILFEKGIFARGRWINLWALSGPKLAKETHQPRLGVIVSRKTSGRANQRNLWKRRIREIFRKIQSQIKDNTSVMIQSKKMERVPAAKDLQQDIEKLLKKTDSLK